MTWSKLSMRSVIRKTRVFHSSRRATLRRLPLTNNWSPQLLSRPSQARVRNTTISVPRRLCLNLKKKAPMWQRLKCFTKRFTNWRSSSRPLSTSAKIRPQSGSKPSKTASNWRKSFPTARRMLPILRTGSSPKTKPFVHSSPKSTSSSTRLRVLKATLKFFPPILWNRRQFQTLNLST